MPTAHANGVEICYETVGDPADPAVLLIHGHGAQLISWDEALIDELVGLGLHVIVFDNRDAGCSTHFDGVAGPDVLAILDGDISSVRYSIEDMADDAAGLLAALEIDDAHVVGISMGGMIAQSFAIRHARRVVTLTSVMSTPDPLRVGTARPEVIERWFEPAPTTKDEVVAAAMESWRATGSVELGLDEAWIHDVTVRQYDRSFDPMGTARQFGAIIGSPDRRPGLSGVTAPTLVVHGAIDPIVTVEGGYATAEAVRGSELIVIDKMGHDLPRAVWPQLLEAFAAHAGI